jgi:heat shock protein 5
MLKDAETFAEQDKLAKEKIDAKNSFDSYIHSMKNTVEDPEKLANKLDEADKKKIKDALAESTKWLEANPSAEKEEYEK